MLVGVGRAVLGACADIFQDAKGDVLRGLQVAEGSCNIPQQMMGEVLEVAKDMETRSYREPLGVVAAICPFSKLF